MTEAASRQWNRRVLFVAYDLHSIGGIQRYSRYELRALAELVGNAGLCVCSLHPRVGPQFDDELAVDVVGRGSSVPSKIGFERRVLRAAKEHRPDLVVCDHIVLAPIALAAARRARATLCVNVYGIEVWGRLPVWRRMALLRADVVVSDCEFTRGVLERRFPALRGRIGVVADCVDTRSFAPAEADGSFRDELGLDGNPVVLTVSRLAPGRSKGQEVVMRALADLRRDSGIVVTYLVVGDGRDRPRLERLARELEIDGSVVFAGSVEDSRLPAVYGLCDVFVLVSGFRLGRNPEGEGVPLVVLEAQACGKPVVTSRLDGSAESIADGETGFLVDPHDPAEVGDALHRLVADRRLREQMGVAARRLAVEQFSFEIFRSRLEQALSLTTAP